MGPEYESGDLPAVQASATGVDAGMATLFHVKRPLNAAQVTKRPQHRPTPSLNENVDNQADLSRQARPFKLPDRTASVLGTGQREGRV